MLTVLTKEQWRKVARLLRPDWTEAQFEAAWIEFCILKTWWLRQ